MTEDDAPSGHGDSMVQTGLELPPRAAADYFKRFDIAALYVLAPAVGLPSQPGATTDLGDALARIGKIWPRELGTPQLSAAWWVSGIRAGQSVCNLTLANDLRGVKIERGRLPLPVPVVAAALTAAAGRLGITLTGYQVGLTRVRQASAAISAKLDEVQASGDLQKFNELYRQARLAAEKHGRRFPHYATCRSRLRTALAVAAATGARIDFARVFEEAP